MKEVKKIDYISFGIVMGCISAILGLIAGIVLIPTMFVATGPYLTPMESIFIGISFISIILYPLVGFVSGFISGLIAALIYNYFLNKYVKFKVE